jgi:hypothetical protein
MVERKRAPVGGWIFVLAILVIVVILLSIWYFWIKLKVPSTCDYNSSVKTYLNKDPKCSLNFLCVRGTQGFKDECGCGCEEVNDTPIGGQRDVHGCLGPAGYSWNETERECVREWSHAEDRYQVTNFITCKDAGYPTTMSSPKECMTPSRRTFIENETS